MVLNEYNNLVVKCYAGDLLDAKVDIIFHVTNCMGVMGAGIAYNIKNKWTKVFNEYKKYVETNGSTNCLGTYQMVDITDYAHTQASQVVNIFGEYTPSRNKRAIEYDETLNALEMFRDDIIKTYKNDKKVVLGFPYLFGCGLAGGDWRIMKSIIFSVFEKYSDKVEIHFYKLKN